MSFKSALRCSSNSSGISADTESDRAIATLTGSPLVANSRVRLLSSSQGMTVLMAARASAASSRAWMATSPSADTSDATDAEGDSGTRTAAVLGDVKSSRRAVPAVIETGLVPGMKGPLLRTVIIFYALRPGMARPKML